MDPISKPVEEFSGLPTLGVKVANVKPSQVLKDAYGQVLQAYGSLIESGTYREPAFCAMGVLGLELGFRPTKRNEDLPSGCFYWELINPHTQREVRESTIGRYWNQKFSTEQDSCPANTQCWCVDQRLVDIVMHLNDDHEWNFQQIGEYLESKGL